MNVLNLLLILKFQAWLLCSCSEGYSNSKDEAKLILEDVSREENSCQLRILSSHALPSQLRLLTVQQVTRQARVSLCKL